MRKLVYKVIVDAIEPMDADTLECARVKGWRIVCKKGDFHPGDTALYFEIDSALNSHDDRFAFLKERCYKHFNVYGKLFDECIRIKTMKLRGVVSQGLLMKPELFCEVRNKKLEEDCSDVLAVRHYDEVAEKAARECGSVKMPNMKGDFPSFIPKTDEERIQNVDAELLERHKDDCFEVTEKADGASMTVFYAPNVRPDDPFGVCSRNLELKDEPSPYWDIVHELNLDIKVPDWVRTMRDIFTSGRVLPQELFELIKGGCDIAIQGELVGPGMNSNRDKYEERHFLVFRIWDIARQKWLNLNERYAFCHALGLEHVRVIGTDFRLEREFALDKDRILQFAEGKTNRGNEREGVVFKTHDGTFSFKAVSNKYLLECH